MNKRKIKSTMNIFRKSGNKILYKSTEKDFPQKNHHEAKEKCKSTHEMELNILRHDFEDMKRNESNIKKLKTDAFKKTGRNKKCIHKTQERNREKPRKSSQKCNCT